MRAGHCSECAANVWLTEDGGCVNGHPASAVSGTYEVDTPSPPASLPERKEVPRWASALWGLVLLALNVFMALYLIAFTTLFSSFSGGAVVESPLALWFYDGFMSGRIAPIAGAAAMMSLAFMALSFAHAFAWSGLAMERKVIWAAVIFAGMQPGMLVYWFVNVWREEGAERHGREPADTLLRRLLLVFLGVLTVLPPLYMVFFIFSIGIATGGADSDFIVRWLPALHLGVMFLWWGLTAFYLVHAFRNPRLEGMARAGWAAAVALGGPLAWPFYWYLNMWRKTPQNTLPSPGE